jgi:hypothetical protein
VRPMTFRLMEWLHHPSLVAHALPQIPIACFTELLLRVVAATLLTGKKAICVGRKSVRVGVSVRRLEPDFLKQIRWRRLAPAFYLRTVQPEVVGRLLCSAEGSKARHSDGSRDEG